MKNLIKNLGMLGHQEALLLVALLYMTANHEASISCAGDEVTSRDKSKPRAEGRDSYEMTNGTMINVVYACNAETMNYMAYNNRLGKDPLPNLMNERRSAFTLARNADPLAGDKIQLILNRPYGHSVQRSYVSCALGFSYFLV